MKGTVKWFNKNRGYGFIVGDDGKDSFVHYQQIQMSGFKALNEGDIVSFDVGIPTADKGKRVQAVNVEPILTFARVENVLYDKGLYLSGMKDQYENRVWIVVDANNVIQSSEQGMNLIELAAYAGISVSEGEVYQ